MLACKIRFFQANIYWVHPTTMSASRTTRSTRQAPNPPLPVRISNRGNKGKPPAGAPSGGRAMLHPKNTRKRADKKDTPTASPPEKRLRCKRQVATPATRGATTGPDTMPTTAVGSAGHARGGPKGGGTALYSPPGRNLLHAQLPDQLHAGHWPGHARCSAQSGGSDHRRPSNVETTPPPQPLLCPFKTTRRQQSRVLYSSLHRGRLGRQTRIQPHPTAHPGG